MLVDASESAKSTWLPSTDIAHCSRKVLQTSDRNIEGPTWLDAAIPLELGCLHCGECNLTVGLYHYSTSSERCLVNDPSEIIILDHSCNKSPPESTVEGPSRPAPSVPALVVAIRQAVLGAFSTSLPFSQNRTNAHRSRQDGTQLTHAPCPRGSVPSVWT